jgi:shikimate kinase
MSHSEHNPITPGTQLVLIGMMGSGKSTVGPLLASRIGLNFQDLDIRLLELDVLNRSAPRILAEDGEDVFRALEVRALQTWLVASRKLGGVLATGGGIISREQGRELLKQEFVAVVWLRARAETLVQRIESDEKNVRPLLDPAEHISMLGRIAELLQSRTKAYQEVADWIIDVDGLTPDDCVDAILVAIS